MSDQNEYSKIVLLFQQGRYADAESILKNLLRQEPNNVEVISLLAEAKLQQDNFEDAETLVNNAIGLSPADPDLFYLKARINIQQDQFDAAEENIQGALELYPYDANFFALKAQLKLSRKFYNEALELADEALTIDAENLLALNTRSTALIKLGRKEESFSTIEGALREDPNNAYTHANYGWGLLEKGDHKKSLEHFKTALQNDPNNEYAQAGLLEALKAKNIVYRLFLKYSFWIGNLTSRYQWAVIIGFYVAARALRAIAASNESLKPFLNPILILLALVAFSTWVITPIGNLFLRLNKYGQLLLDKKEKMSSSLVAIALLLLIGGLITYLILNDQRFMSFVVVGFILMPVFGVMYAETKPKNILLLFAIGMVILGAVGIVNTFASIELFNPLMIVFGIAFIAFQWGSNILMINQGNR